MNILPTANTPLRTTPAHYSVIAHDDKTSYYAIPDAAAVKTLMIDTDYSSPSH